MARQVRTWDMLKALGFDTFCKCTRFISTAGNLTSGDRSLQPCTGFNAQSHCIIVFLRADLQKAQFITEAFI